jgi:DnaJ-class molecular chaperone
MRDPYDVLGVARSASDADIKKAFRNLAKKHHPDQNQNNPKAQEAFSELNSAYEILGDKEKRLQFDRGEIGADGKPRFASFDAHGFDPSGFAARGRGGAAGPGVFDDFLSDVLGQAMGGGAGTRSSGFRRAAFDQAMRPTRGEDVSATVLVALEDIVDGGKVRVRLSSGKTLDVTLPEGVVDGQQMRLKGQGLVGTAGGPAGDAIITVSFQPHPDFRLVGADLHHDLAVSLEDAALGGRVRVPTLEGAVDLTIPPRTTGLKPLRLRGKGMPIKGGGRGDVYVTPRIILPESGDMELEAFLKARRKR